MSTIREKLATYMPWRWVNYNIHISLKNKYVYCEIPKVACSTIKRTLTYWEMEDLGCFWSGKTHRPFYETPFARPYQLPIQTLEDILTGDEFFKFIFVRNPYSRTLSCYLEKIVQKKPASRMIYRELTETHTEEDLISYPEFLSVISKLPSNRMDSHFRPQLDQSFGDTIKFNFVGRFEQFEQDFAQVRDRIACPDEYYQTDRYHRVDAENNLAEYYGKKERDLVNSIYQKDFESFGYSQD